MEVIMWPGALTEPLTQEKRLIEAAKNGDRKAVELELATGEVPKETAFHYAIINGYVDIAELLLDRGANVNAVNKRGETALHLAATRQNAKAVLVLIARGANVNAADADGITPLHDASHAVDGCDTVRVLVYKGAGLNARTRHGRTPLHSAVDKGDIKSAAFLIEKGAKVNIKDENGRTPLDIAIREAEGEYATRTDKSMAELLRKAAVAEHQAKQHAERLDEQRKQDINRSIGQGI
jgi:ankyrin repeat protein